MGRAPVLGEDGVIVLLWYHARLGFVNLTQIAGRTESVAIRTQQSSAYELLKVDQNRLS